MEEPDSAGRPPQEPVRAGRRLAYPGSVFLLALLFSASSLLVFLASVEVFGADVTDSFFSLNPSYSVWIQRAADVVFFSAFFLIGRKVDFGRRYASLAVSALVGAFLGAFPEFVVVHATRPGRSALGYVVSLNLSSILQISATFFETFAIAVTGLGLAFLIRARMPSPAVATQAPAAAEVQQVLPTESPPAAAAVETQPPPAPAEEAARRTVSTPFLLLLGFAIVAMAYISEATIDIVGTRFFPGHDAYAFVRTIFVVSPYSEYAVAFFFPLLFFISFYFVGRTLDTGSRGLEKFVAAVFVAGALGFLVGYPADYYLRSLAAPAGEPFPPLRLGSDFVQNVVVEGFYVLAVGLAAASLGFARIADKPYNQDKWYAISLVTAILLSSATWLVVVTA